MTANVDGTSVRQILNAGAATAVTARLAPGDRGALSGVVPDGYRLAVQEYDLPGERPRRRSGTVTLTDIRSFAGYYLKHRETDTEVYASVGETGGGGITAVINASGGSDDLAGWRDHRAVMPLTHTPEWKRWISQNDVLLPQTAFAEHIEAGLSQIVSPSGADMLDVAQSLTGATKVEWESATRLSDGQTRFTHRETTDAQVRDGLEIPSTFTLQLRPWVASLLAVRVEARLRYRIQGGQAALGYVLTDLDSHIEGVTNDLLGELGDALNSDVPDNEQVLILRGTP